MTSNSLFSLTPQRQPPSSSQQHEHTPQHSLSQPETRASSPLLKNSAQTLPFDAEAMQEQLESFVRDNLFDSAQLLGELLVSVANTASSGSYGGKREDALLLAQLPRDFHGKSFRLFADLLFKKREFKRAIQYYKRSWKVQIGSTNTSASAEANALRVKMAQCWIELDGFHQAIDILDNVPVPLRSLTVNLLLGKLYLSEGLKSKAEESYRTALRQNPYALEATLALADIAATRESTTVMTPSAAPLGNLTSGNTTTAMGSTSTTTTTTTTGGTGAGPSAAQGSVTDPAFWQRELERFYSTLPSIKPLNNKSVVLRGQAEAEWLQMLVRAHIHAKRGRYRAAMESFTALEVLFPNNLHCLLHKGKLEMDQEFFHQAHLNFHRARQLDDQNLSMMDTHADCLRRSGARIQLNSLVQDLFETSDDHAVCWLAAAYLSDMKGEHETALQFSERAVLADTTYAPAHLFQGTLLLQLNRPEHALVAFTKSCKLNKTLEAYGGLITSYCELCLKGINKYKEALSTSKTIVKLYPHRAQSYTLLGNVFALREDYKEQAKKAYQRALAMEPRKLAAVFGLVDLCVRDGEFTRAIHKLTALAEQCPREEIFTKLADVHTLNKQFPDAMTFYHRALSVNPGSATAARGLERLEKMMRGEDPDDLNSTMEHMEGDEQDDSMDAGEYVAS